MSFFDSPYGIGLSGFLGVFYSIILPIAGVVFFVFSIIFWYRL